MEVGIESIVAILTVAITGIISVVAEKMILLVMLSVIVEDHAVIIPVPVLQAEDLVMIK